MNLSEFQSEWMPRFDAFLYSELDERVPSQENLHKAMAYSLMGGGKRIRPLLVLATLWLADGEIADGFAAAAALEYIHTYSLIHDDLPAMDDDDYRRGRLTSHKVFGESTAILAGDALLTAAFEILAQSSDIPAEKRIKLIDLLAKASGPNGMIAGQMDDVEGEKKALTIEELKQVHDKKTGALIRYAVTAGCLIADADELFITEMERYSRHLGLAYQIHNDLKDVVLDEAETGKTIHHDAALNKNTYPSLLGIAGAIQELNDVIRQAEDCLNRVVLSNGDTENKIDVFRQILDYVRI